MRPFCFFFFWPGIVVCVALTGWSSLLQAAEPASPAASVKPETLAIAAAYIPEQADQDERFTQQVLARSSPFDANGQLALELTQLHQEILQLTTAYTREELSPLTAPRLNSVEDYWGLYARRLDRWQARVQTATSRYSADAGELERRRAAWETTLKSSRTLPPALLDRVNDIMERLQVTQDALSAPLNQAIDLGRRGNQVRRDLDRGAKGVSDAIDIYTRRLLTIDTPPLWAISGPETPTELSPFAAPDTIGASIEVAFLRHYVSEQGRHLLTFGLIWLASLSLFLWFAWRERQLQRANPDTPSPSPVLRRPISGWLLLGAMGLPLVFANAPVALQQASLLVGLIPVLRLLPGEAFKVLRWLPYAIVALYFGQRARILFWDDPLYYRLHLLLITIVTAAMGLWLLLTSGRRPAVIRGRRRILLRTLGWLAVAALTISAIANAVGNVSLAEMLTTGVIESTYVGLAIYAGMSAVLAIGGILLADPASDQTGFLARNLPPLRSGLHNLIVVGAILLWAVVAIDEFQIYRPTAEWLTALLTRPVSLGRLHITLGGVLLFGLSVWVALWIARTTRLLLQNEILSNMRLPPGVANSVASLTYYSLVFVGLLVALAASGFEVGQLTLVLGALGVGIGLGLQNIVANFISGLILMFERPLRPGDVVEVGGVTGRVREIGMRATTLQTFEGADVVVPNGTLLSGNLINWTLNNNNRRIDVDVGVSYSADPPTVQLLLAQVTRTIPGIATQPEPVVLFLRFNASSLDFGIRAWTSDFENWRSIQSALSVAVHQALKEAGIEIPFPQRDLHLRTISDAARSQLTQPALAERDGDGARANPITPSAASDRSNGDVK